MTARGLRQGLVLAATVVLHVLALKEVSVYFINSDGVVNGRTKRSKDCGMFRESEHVNACIRDVVAGGELRVDLVCTPKTFLYAEKLFDMQFTMHVLSCDDVVDVLMLARDLRLRNGDEKTTFYHNLARATEVNSSVFRKVRELKMQIPDVYVYALQLLRVCAGAQNMDVRVCQQHAVLCAQDPQYCCYGCAEKVDTVVSMKVHCRVARAIASRKDSLKEVLGWFIDVADVRALDMQGCKVSGLEAWVSGFERLQTLNMSKSNIDAQGLVHIQRLTSLKKLNISHNKLQRRMFVDMCMEQPAKDGMSAVVSLPRLSSLNIAYCGLSARDVVHVGKIGSLRELDVSGNSVDKKFMSVLCKLEGLELLNMNSCELSEGNIAHLRGLTTLKSLCVSQNKLSREDMMSIGTLTSLVLLNIADCRLTGGSLTQLQGLAQLCNLNVSQNRLDGEDIASIKELRNLRVLIMRGCSVESRELEQLQGELHELDISGVRLVTESASAIGRMQSLRRLCMHDCGRNQGVLASLGGLKNLEYLSVSRARISADDTAAVCKMESLQVLNMYMCRVEKGCLKTLKRLEQLRRLDMGWTPLSDVDLEAIRRMKNTEVFGVKEMSMAASSFIFLWPYREASLRPVLESGEKRGE